MKEQYSKITAKEAREEAEKYPTELDRVYKEIRVAAENGEFSLYMNLTSGTWGQLEETLRNEGYSVRQYTEELKKEYPQYAHYGYGVDSIRTVISWEGAN